MKSLLYIIIALIVLLLFNYTPLSYLFSKDYSYRNFDSSFTISEEGGKGYDFEVVNLRYERFLKSHPLKKSSDPKLYRTFTMQPWYIWQWGDFIFQNERFRLPYKSPEELNKH